MAFSGFLIKVGNTEIPIKFIKAETYSVLLSGQDLDSYRDSNGDLHRTALEHVIPKVEFETKALLTNKDVAELMGIIRSNYINSVEKSVNVTCYVPELDSYVTQKCYVPDITFSMYLVDREKNFIQYNSTRIAFIGYGGKA